MYLSWRKVVEYQAPASGIGREAQTLNPKTSAQVICNFAAARLREHGNVESGVGKLYIGSFRV